MGMYGRVKYITFENKLGDPDGVVFSDVLIHRDVARGLWLRDERILGAGFWTGSSCAGVSETLKKKSRPEDTAIIQKLLGIKSS